MQVGLKLGIGSSSFDTRGEVQLQIHSCQLLRPARLANFFSKSFETQKHNLYLAYCALGQTAPPLVLHDPAVQLDVQAAILDRASTGGRADWLRERFRPVSTHLLLLRGVVEDCTAVLCPDISALPVLGGWIMSGEECIAQCLIRDLLGVICHLEGLCVSCAP